MSLQAKCARCQGIFSNFRQTVERNGATYCVQCADAIANGASPRMYEHELETHCVFLDPKDAVAREGARWAFMEQVDHSRLAEADEVDALSQTLNITSTGRHVVVVDVGIVDRRQALIEDIISDLGVFVHYVQGETAKRIRAALHLTKPGRHAVAFDVLNCGGNA